MRITRPLTRVLLATALWACALTGFAQTAPDAAPPIRSSIDGNGVDRLRLLPQFSTTDLTIGQLGAGGMAFTRQYYLRGWRHNFIGTINSSGTTYTVSIGGDSESFTQDGSSYTSQQGSGSTLTYDSSTHKYTFQDSKGTVAVFNQTWMTVSDVSSNEGIIESLTYPSGEKLSFFYATINVCDYSTGCSFTWTVRRLQGVRNSFGYLIKFSYPFNGTSPMDAVNQNQWLTYSSVTGINVATDYCNPQADSCPSFSQTWPTSSYSRSGSTETVTDTMGRQTIYTYNNAGIAGIRRPGSLTDDVSIVYDTDTSIGIVQSVTRNGMTWTYSSQTSGNTFYTRATDLLGHVNEMGFDTTSSLLVSQKNGAGEQTIYQYDVQGRLQGLYLPDGTSRGYSYDSRGNLTSVLMWPNGGGAAVTVFSAGYDATCPTSQVKCNKPNWTRDAYNNETDYTYSTTHGGVLTVTLPAPSPAGGVRPVTTSTWTSLQAYFYRDAAGSLVASGEGVYLLTQTSSCRTLATCAGGADELRTVISYGADSVANNRLPVTTTVGDGLNSISAMTTTGYDPVGNIVSVDGPLAGTVDTYVTHYDALRRVIGQVGPDPDGGGPRPSVAVRTTYDARGAPVSVETGTVAGQTVAAWSGFVPLQAQSQDFDNALRLIKSTLSAGGVTYAVEQTSYDAMSRVDCVATRMNPSSFSSLPVSACTSTAPGSFGPDRIVKSSYDSADRLVSTTSGFGTANAITEQTRSFATSGKLATLADGKGNTTSYEYDSFGRLFRIHYPDPNSAGISSATDYEEFQYDLNSKIVGTRRRSGDVISTPRDTLGRITVKDLPGTTSEDVYFSYDNDGRVLSALFGSPSGTGIVQGYDGLGRLTSRVVNGRTIGYGYDSAGRRTRLTYPDGYFVTYGYSNADELLTLADSNGATLATYSYDAQGSSTGITRPNSATTSMFPDAIRRLQTLQHDLAGTAYDSTTGLSYSPAHEIASRTQSNDAAYTWTPIPNTTDTSVVDGQNQLTNFNGTPTTRDSNGDLQAGTSSYSYGYDLQGQLRSATGGGNVVAVDYDPTGMLSTVTVNGAATDYLYDGSNLIAEYSGATLLRRFVHGVGADQPLVWFEGSGTTAPKFLHADERGSIIAVSDATGAASASVKYSPEGQSGALVSPFGYTGQLYIPALDLYYYKARMYSPRTGRFMQPDPARYAGGMNLYAYVSGDPVNRTDPSGLEDMATVHVSACGAVCQQSQDEQWLWNFFFFANARYFATLVTPPPQVVVSATKPQRNQKHHYSIKTPTTCPAPRAFDALKAPGVSAPGAPAAQEGFTQRVNLSGGNPISQSVSTPTMTIVNTTLPGHIFYPGTVTWQVSPMGTGSVIDVTGTGTGAHPYFNDLVGELFFGLMSYLVQTGCDAANGIPSAQ